MQTSLHGIAKKAAQDNTYRFRNLFGMLTAPFLIWCWQFLNRRSAPGVDRLSVREYEQSFFGNVLDLVKRVKRGVYRARLILRCDIPKGGGKWRPLGLPVTEDKLLQTAVAKILDAIYEQEFLPCSFGYRAGIGAREAVKQLSRWLYYRPMHYVVEADIRGYFDHIDHDHLLTMLAKRIDDKPFLGLIRKWLKAGILDTDGQVIHPATGTPQGGIISPVLANIYLHYVLDAWFDKASFVFLGFEFQWRVSWKSGKVFLLKRTAPKKLRQSLRNFTEWCKTHRHWRMTLLMDRLRAKLRGYYQYYGIRGNTQWLVSFYNRSMSILFTWLNRRSQKRSYSWPEFAQLLREFDIPRPKVVWW